MTDPRRTGGWPGRRGSTGSPRSEAGHSDRVPAHATIERIVVPLDGSTIAQTALPHAIALAGAFDAKLLLLSVTEPPPAGGPGVDSAEWRLARAGTWAYLQRTAAACSKLGIETDWTVAEGAPSEEILRFSEENRADIIVLCSHGSGGLSEFRVSGTASKVIHSAPCSVFLARAEAAIPTGAAVYDRVLVPVDCTKRSDWAVHMAGSIARSHGAELLLGTVITRPEVLGDSMAQARAAPLAEELVRLNRSVAQRYLRRLAADVTTEEHAIRHVVVESEHVGQALHAMAEAEGCSLIVLAAHGGCPAPGWPFGSVPSLLLEHAQRPILVLQDTAWKSHGTHASLPDEAASGLPAHWT